MYKSIIATVIIVVSLIMITINVQTNLDRKARMQALELCIAGNERIVKENKSNFPPVLMSCRL